MSLILSLFLALPSLQELEIELRGTLGGPAAPDEGRVLLAMDVRSSAFARQAKTTC